MRRLILAAALLAAPAVAQGGPRVTIDTGAIAGAQADGVVSYKGIPFAQPPVGPLRWRAPQPVARWPGVRDATGYAHDCMQKPFPSDAAPLGTAPAEDCLYANVWRPAGAAKKLPVMVWIYGGGFVNGGSSPPTYSGAALAKHGIVVVSFNYRLGRFGTFVHPQLTRADADGGLLADYGYMDQLAALRWVRRNVAAFGGDPARVTIVGESAGGYSVHFLLTSPMAKGLFAQAVIESGGTGSTGDTTMATAERKSLAFARAHGIGNDDPDALARLRALPADQVVDGLNLATTKANADTYSAPAPDGRLSVDPLTAYRAGAFAHVPIMIGATSDDIGGPTGPMLTGARDLSNLLTGKGVPVWRYRFSYVASSIRTPETKGAAHASDIPFFFGTAAIKYGQGTTPTDRRASDVASGYLANFVRTGDPNGPGLPTWTRFTAGGGFQDLTAEGDAAPVAGE